MEGDSEELLNYKKKIIKEVKKNIKRRATFEHLTNYIGKGIKSALKAVRINNENKR